MIGVVVGGVVIGGGVVGAVGIEGVTIEVSTAGIATFSFPIGANGFGLPSLPSGTSTILESCKLVNALSEKIASFNFILLTLNNNTRNSLAITEFWSGDDTVSDATGFVDEEEIKLSTGGAGLKNKI